MSIKYGNSDADITYDLSVSKAAGVNLTYNFLLNGATEDIHLDTWQLLINNPAGTAVVTLTSGSGLTINGALIAAAITPTNLAALTVLGGYSYQLKDTTAGRTRISGNFLLQP